MIFLEIVKFIPENNFISLIFHEIISMPKLKDFSEGPSEVFNLKNVVTIDQTRFEQDILIKADRDYKTHVNEERSSIATNLKDVSARIKILNKSIKELNECLVHNLTSKSSDEEFNKIRNSLNNQLDMKKQELARLSRLEARYRDQLTSIDISEKFNEVLDAGKKNRSAKNRVRSTNKASKTKRHASNEGVSESIVTPPDTIEVIPDDSDACSVESAATEIFEASREQLELTEPLLKRPRLIRALEEVESTPKTHVRKSGVKRFKSGDKLMDDGDRNVFLERLGTNVKSVDAESLENGFLVPQTIWTRLYGYQQAGVRWLLQLHLQSVGGILGDEMGLGKTAQVIAFFAGLRHSAPAFESGPFLIVCPATVMRQWVDEFHEWGPQFRVALLHSTGSGYARPERLIEAMAGEPGALVTSYSSMVLHHALLLRHRWQYVVLDEGHKIKNPNTKVTLCAKKIETPHRLILSGTPIQNNLKELWSLVDFVYPGRLGSLASFIQHFALPIMKGGYEHASPVQVETAYRCACVIRDTINEYLLRRTKAEVELQLPRKTEQVLFCGLSPHQLLVYREYLASRQCADILAGKQVPFPGLVTLRKICNHPDLVTGGPKAVIDHPVLGFGREVTDDGLSHKFGHWSRSGKMVVVKELLRVWFRGRHKVLLFTQGRMMLQILRRFIEHQGYPLCCMDGGTALASRHAIVTRFNESAHDELFVFLLTTRVGGLGLNLVGADRVLVFDPDWNPCTDLQARERAWRIGQNRKVVIYRLVISGGVEEKIYHRQVFKQFLTNRILKNPRQRRFFKTQDLRGLFRLDEPGTPSDTSLMLHGSRQHRRVRAVAAADNNYFDGPGAAAALALGPHGGGAGGGGIEDDDDDDDDDDNHHSSRTGHTAAAASSPVAAAATASELNLAQLDVPDDSAIVTGCSLSERELERLRRQARKLSCALSRLQQASDSPVDSPAHAGGGGDRGTAAAETGAISTEVEGELIANVRARQPFRDTSAPALPSSTGEHIVSTLLPTRQGGGGGTAGGGGASSSMSYTDMCTASRVADRAKKSLEHVLGGAGVTERVYHDKLIDDVTPDWSLVQREADRTAKSAVAWLRSLLMPPTDSASGDATRAALFGTCRNSFLWNRDEETVYFQITEPLSGGHHFSGKSAAAGVSLCHPLLTGSDPGGSHLRFSSRILLSVIRNRSRTQKGDSPLLSAQVKGLTKNLFLFLSQACPHHETTSTDLIDRFRGEVSARNNMLFKSVVNELCSFQRVKDSHIGGIWRLRADFIGGSAIR